MLMVNRNRIDVNIIDSKDEINVTRSEGIGLEKAANATIAAKVDCSDRKVEVKSDGQSHLVSESSSNDRSGVKTTSTTKRQVKSPTLVVRLKGRINMGQNSPKRGLKGKMGNNPMLKTGKTLTNSSKKALSKAKPGTYGNILRA